MSYRAVLGIDPSLTACAVALAKPGAPIYERTLSSKPASGVAGRLKRYRGIVCELVELASQSEPELVLIEGYSFGSVSGQSGHHDRAEFRGVLLDRLLPKVGAIMEIAPSALKKFATGRGTAGKSEVVSALAQRYKRTFRSDDQADAFTLMQMGLCLAGQSAPETQFQREVIAALRDKRRELAGVSTRER